MNNDEPTFSEEEARGARLALRKRLGLGEERFPLSALVGMISDEIGKMREAGHSDETVAGIVADATGRQLSADDLVRHYVPPDGRH